MLMVPKNVDIFKAWSCLEDRVVSADQCPSEGDPDSPGRWSGVGSCKKCRCPGSLELLESRSGDQASIPLRASQAIPVSAGG